MTTISPLLRAALAAVLLALAGGAQAATCRVAPDGNASNNGSTWQTPTTLAQALASSDCDEVWVKQGTYQPGSPLTLARNVVLRGGFAGTETAAAERPLPLNPALTVLDGGGTHRILDIDGISTAITSSTVIEGFTMRNGKATFGGAVYCGGSCSPHFTHVTFSGNSSSYGGAVYNFADGNGVDASPSFTNVTFSGNSSRYGGAVDNFANGSGATVSPHFTNVTFSGNSATWGGAVNNSADSNDATVSSYFTNVTFSGNSSSYGGAVYNSAGSNDATVSSYFTNTILWGNTASFGPQILNAYPATATLTHSIVQGGCPSSATCTSTGSSDPQLGLLQDNGGGMPTHLPAPGSPALGIGGASHCPATDQRGVARPQGAACDMGAVQRRTGVTTSALQVSVSGSGSVSAQGGGILACTATQGVCATAYEGVALDVVLSATADAGQAFTGWGGACTGSAPTCTVSMDQARSVTAAFALVSHTDTGGTGVTVGITDDAGGATCTFTAPPSFQSAPASVPGYAVLPHGQIGWQAQCANVGDTAVITLTLPTAVPANAVLLKAIGGTWTPWPMQPVGGDWRVLRYAVADGSAGDADPALRMITDPVLLAVPLADPAANAQAIPTLGTWALGLLSLLAGGLGGRRLRGAGRAGH